MSPESRVLTLRRGLVTCMHGLTVHNGQKIQELLAGGRGELRAYVGFSAWESERDLGLGTSEKFGPRDSLRPEPPLCVWSHYEVLEMYL